MKKSPRLQKSILGVLRNKRFVNAMLACLCFVFFFTSAFTACHFFKDTKYIEICSGMGTKLVAVADDTSGSSDKDNHDQHKKSQIFCPYCYVQKTSHLNSDMMNGLELSKNIQNFGIYFKQDYFLQRHDLSLSHPRAPPALI